MAMFVITEK